LFEQDGKNIGSPLAIIYHLYLSNNIITRQLFSGQRPEDWHNP